VIDAAAAREAGERIMDRYHISSDRSAGGDTPRD
jgi:hypothetical protein